ARGDPDVRVGVAGLLLPLGVGGDHRVEHEALGGIDQRGVEHGAREAVAHEADAEGVASHAPYFRNAVAKVQARETMGRRTGRTADRHRACGRSPAGERPTARRAAPGASTAWPCAATTPRWCWTCCGPRAPTASAGSNSPSAPDSPRRPSARSPPA